MIRCFLFGMLAVLCLTACATATSDRDPQIDQQLAAAKRYDVLAERRAADLDRAAAAGDLKGQLAAAMALADIHARHLIDFDRADTYCREADRLNEELWGADYARNAERLAALRRELAVRKAGVTTASAAGGSAEPVEKALGGMELGRAERDRLVARAKNLAAQPPEKLTDEKVRILAAGVVAAAAGERTEAGLRFDGIVRQAVALAGRRLERQTAEARKQHRRNRVSHAGRLLSTAYSTIAVVGIGAITLGTVFLNPNERGVAASWLGSEYGELERSRTALAHTEPLARVSAFAGGLNLYLNYHEQIPYFAALGRLKRQAGHLEAAAGAGRQGVALLEMLRRSISAETERIAYVALRTGLYDDLVSVLMALGDATEALRYAERARSRAFLDAIGAGPIRFVDDEATAAYQRILACQRDVSAMLGETGLHGVRAAHLERKLRDIHTVASGSSGGRKAIRLASVIVPELGGLQERIDDGTAFLVYHVTDREVFGWRVDRRRIDGRRLAIEPAVLRRRAYDFSRRCADPQQPTQDTVLYRHLVEPLAPAAGCRRLIVVRHGVLHGLPFAALPCGDGRMIDRFGIGYAPSLAVWQVLADGKRRSPSRLLTIGPPAAGGPWPPLPHAHREIEQVAAIYPAHDSIGPQADAKQRLRRAASEFSVLHFACHGVFDTRDPLQSGLVLGDGPEGILRGREILGMDMPDALVVLSACETGRLRVAGGDELFGLVRAFHMAGARQIVAGLWPVADAATADLMIAFHRELKDHGAVEALRRAQDRMRARHRHPYYWAAFGVYGGP